MRKYIAIIIASLALFTGQAHAQRCLPKMQGIEVRADMADGFNLGGKDGGYSFGAALSTYTKKGNKWVFGGEYLLKNNPYKDTKIPVAQFTAEGGYYFKILSDARKIVFVYAGASALAGYEAVNWGKKVLHDGSTLHDPVAVLQLAEFLLLVLADCVLPCFRLFLFREFHNVVHYHLAVHRLAHLYLVFLIVVYGLPVNLPIREAVATAFLHIVQNVGHAIVYVLGWVAVALGKERIFLRTLL